MMPQWLVNLLANNTPACEEVLRLISDSMERPLPLRRRISIRIHFIICKWCARYQKQLRLIRSLLRRDPGKAGENAPATLSPEAKERIKQAVRRDE
jgi:hypothetical protein